ncbi:MAG: hypothetical protein NT175_07355 [Bacteroidetes bacterium]|nr:hypothetical protein [Bacteroidota bacterium]
MVVSHNSLEELKYKIKENTRKTIPASFDERIERLTLLMRGWLNYFKAASIYGKLKTLDGWVRNRLRYCIWHHWKKPRRRVKNLIRLGVPDRMAWQWATWVCVGVVWFGVWNLEFRFGIWNLVFGTWIWVV